MDADAKVMERGEFLWKYGRDYPSATFEQTDAAYNEYKDFYAKYHQDNPGATTDCYAEFLKTHGKQASNTRLLGDRRATGRRVEYCYWFCAILQKRQSRRY